MFHKWRSLGRIYLRGMSYPAFKERMHTLPAVLGDKKVNYCTFEYTVLIYISIKIYIRVGWILTLYAKGPLRNGIPIGLIRLLDLSDGI